MRGHDHTGDGRERLLVEARRLFLERGYAEVSMQEIAAAADMTRAAPYYHFRDKEDLFVQVFICEMQLGSQLLAERLREASCLRDRLLVVLNLAAESGRSSLGQLITELDRHVSAERRRRMKAECPTPSDAIRGIFERAAAEHELTRLDAGSAYALFMAIMIGQMEIVRTTREMQEFVGADVPAAPEVIVDAFLHGV